MSKYEVGQMVEISWVDKEGNARWQYMVVVKVYDDRTQFIREYGGRFMESHAGDEDRKEATTDGSKEQIRISPLYQNGKPVFSKRSFFGLGRYTFEPTTK
ncbi:hypothetical protein PP657_gp097 [Bacillus phage BCPST]|uniref:Uncharacterized protein n=1 Tax=Bacillus phage BCPST TaxID=2801506 RepID=A0AAE7P715_9CAUD|nr:hypothetical protein PP657_gp097 [Bacillus phage BCPST]QQO38725.1 hypothetical protein BCPST_107 [Bacillus phage BCPST]QSJ04312.1 hypothetical protein BCP6_108 [Bacillus phage BCP6]